MSYSKDKRRKLRLILFISIFAVLGMNLLSGFRDEASAYPAGWSEDRRLTFNTETSVWAVSTFDSNNNL